jgi:dihydrofolate synthase/folylpolyglutamate synthase
MISEDGVAEGLSFICNFVADWKPHPTFFEITTALALRYFRQQRAEIVVLETGMGGRLDATNAVRPIVSIITPIALDHQKWLGDTLAEIAGEKAGIIKRGVAVVSARQLADAEKTLRARATELGSSIQFVDQVYDGELALKGTHQKQNATLAIAAFRAAKFDINKFAIASGLQSVHWPARFQCWGECTIIDGAHNPSGAKILAQTWRAIFGDKRATLILAVLNDKDIAGICRELAPITQCALLPQIRSERALAPRELAKILSATAPSLPYSITPSVAAALDEARKHSEKILITGSLHFAGEALPRCSRPRRIRRMRAVIYVGQASQLAITRNRKSETCATIVQFSGTTAPVCRRYVRPAVSPTPHRQVRIAHPFRSIPSSNSVDQKFHGPLAATPAKSKSR